MKISRKLSSKINYILDQYLPPFIRDSKLFMLIPFKILFKGYANSFLYFKGNVLKMNGKDYRKLYKDINSVLVHGVTDLSKACIQEIIKNTCGRNVLEVGCGRGFLSVILCKNFSVTASDIIIDKSLIRGNHQIKFIKADIEHLPFKNHEFDTTICTHTLEHIVNIFDAVKELRRVTKKRLIIVVPKQRPYKYTFNLHVHFFPYEHSLLYLMGTNRKNLCKSIDGDLYYQEDIE